MQSANNVIQRQAGRRPTANTAHEQSPSDMRQCSVCDQCISHKHVVANRMARLLGQLSWQAGCCNLTVAYTGRVLKKYALAVSHHRRCVGWSPALSNVRFNQG
jgi:hypothetical protein